MFRIHMLQYFTTAFRDLYNSTKRINPENIYALSVLFLLKVRLVKSIIFYNSLLQSFILSESYKSKLEMLTYTEQRTNQNIFICIWHFIQYYKWYQINVMSRYNYFVANYNAQKHAQ